MEDNKVQILKDKKRPNGQITEIKKRRSHICTSGHEQRIETFFNS
jgi:hypothetical protein